MSLASCGPSSADGTDHGRRRADDRIHPRRRSLSDGWRAAVPNPVARHYDWTHRLLLSRSRPRPVDAGARAILLCHSTVQRLNASNWYRRTKNVITEVTCGNVYVRSGDTIPASVVSPGADWPGSWLLGPTRGQQPYASRSDGAPSAGNRASPGPSRKALCGNDFRQQRTRHARDADDR